MLGKHLKNSIRTLLVAGALLASSFVQVAAQSAQELPAGNGFQVSPVRQEFDLAPGSSQVVTITVENPSNSEIIASPVVNNFLPSEDESGTPRLILDKNVLPPANDFERLVQPLEEFTIGPGRKVDVDVIISAPRDVRAGGYYGAVRFVPILPGLGDAQNVALTASVGTIFLVTIPGDLKQQLDLVQLSAAEGDSPKGFFIGGNVSIATRLKNSGDIHVQPFGKVQVKNFFSKVLHEYEFNNTEPRANILPDSTRKFIDQIPQSKWFGRYTITANLGYGSNGQLITAKTAFWYFSTLVFYLLLVGLFVLVAAVYWLVRRFKKRRGKRGKNPY